MNQKKCEVFRDSIKDDPPILKLLKYFSLIQSSSTLALNLLPQITQIALSNNYPIVFIDICQKLQVSYQDNPTLKQLRQSMVNDTNSLYSDLKYWTSNQNAVEKAQTLFKLGQALFKYGEFKQAQKQFDALSQIPQHHNVKYESYATQLALSLIYQKQFTKLSRVNTKHVDRSILKKMTDLCIIRDLNNIDSYFRNQNFGSLGKLFKNVLDLQISNLQISKNKVMGYSDLGFIYSILAIAYTQKQQIKRVKWSNHLQNKFLNNRYKQILQTLQQQKQKRCYLPFIQNIYDTCQKKILKRILIDIVSSYDRCPFKIIQNITGIKQGAVKLFAKNNPDAHFIFDQITHSAVINRNVQPLYIEVQTLYTTLKRKYQEQMSVEARDQDQFGMGRRGFMGGMGMGGMGMGRMGGMGRMHGHDMFRHHM